MPECIFCQIAKGEQETEVIRETENLVLFKDINPQASIHILIVPKKHIKDVTKADSDLWNEIKDAANYFAREKGLKGFRLSHNAGDAAMVKHMHVHLLADVSPERAL